MRVALLLLVGLSLAAPFAASANAAIWQTPGLGAGQNPAVIEAASRCGRHFHYVRGHRNRYGHWVRGRCVPNHRR